MSPVSSRLSGHQPLSSADPEGLRGTTGLRLPGQPGPQITEAPTPLGLFCFVSASLGMPQSLQDLSAPTRE